MSYIKVGAWYTSSVDPEKVGKLVTGVMLGAATVALLLARSLHIPLFEEQWSTIAITFGQAVTSLLVAYGIAQKVFVWVFVKKIWKQFMPTSVNENDI